MKSSRSPHELQVKQTESQPVHIKVRRLSAAAMAAAGVMIPFAKAEKANAQPLNGGMQYVEKTDRHLSDADRKYERRFIARLNTRVSQNLQDGEFDDGIYSPTVFDGLLVKSQPQGKQHQVIEYRPLTVDMPPRGQEKALDSGTTLVGYINRSDCTAHFRPIKDDETLEPTTYNEGVSSYTFYFKQGKNGLRDFSRAYTVTLPNGEEANDFVLLRNPDHSPMTDIAQLPAQD
jgi:hypothetical protein